MSIQAKILDAYSLYLLCNKNATKTLSFTKITRPTLKRYVMIQEYLDFTSTDYLTVMIEEFDNQNKSSTINKQKYKTKI